MRTLVVANPKSRGGSTRKRFRALEGRLREAIGPFEVEWTRAPRDAERIAREGVRAGVERVVVAGGDGTLSEVATGLLAADLGRYARVGVLPLGTGGDFARTAGIPRDPTEAIALLSADEARPVDAGRVRYHDRAGKPATAYFVNVASFGISGLVDEMVNRTTKALGGTVSFLVGTLRALARYRSRAVTVRLDGAVLHEGPLVLGVAANGRYFGGGMHIAPEARPDDGLMDVVVTPDLGTLALLRRLPRLYAGKHVGDSALRFARGRVLEADAEPGTVFIDIDGEPLGSLPLSVEMVPGALSLVGLRA